MKLFLLSTLLLTTIGRFGDCGGGGGGSDIASTSNSKESSQTQLQQSCIIKPAIRKKSSLGKSVSFNEKEDSSDPPIINEETIFLVNFKKFERSVSNRLKSYGKRSFERQLLKASNRVVKRIYYMFNTISYYYTQGFLSSEAFLCQNDGEPPFPEKEDVDEFQEKANHFEKCLLKILLSLQPTYEYIEKLINAIDFIHDHMNENWEKFDEMQVYLLNLNEIYDEFKNILNNSKLDDYIKHARIIRRLIVIDFEKGTEESEEMATEESKEITTEGSTEKATEKIIMSPIERYALETKGLKETYPVITKAIKLLQKTRFKDLKEAIMQISELLEQIVTPIEDQMGALEIPTGNKASRDAAESLRIEEEMFQKQTSKMSRASSNPVDAQKSLMVAQAMYEKQRREMSRASSSLSSSSATIERRASSVGQLSNSLRHEGKMASNESSELRRRSCSSATIREMTPNPHQSLESLRAEQEQFLLESQDTSKTSSKEEKSKNKKITGLVKNFLNKIKS